MTQTELCKYGQEPKSCTSNPMDCQCAIDAALAQTQEPVACEHKRTSIWTEDQTGHCNDCGASGRMRFIADTTPSQRTWVDLTDEDVMGLCRTFMGQFDKTKFIKATEDKIKELNT